MSKPSRWERRDATPQAAHSGEPSGRERVQNQFRMRKNYAECRTSSTPRPAKLSIYDNRGASRYCHQTCSPCSCASMEPSLTRRAECVPPAQPQAGDGILFGAPKAFGAPLQQSQCSDASDSQPYSPPRFIASATHSFRGVRARSHERRGYSPRFRDRGRGGCSAPLLGGDTGVGALPVHPEVHEGLPIRRDDPL